MSWPSLSPLTLLAIYCALTLLASLGGGLLPLLIHLTHTRLQVAISFVAGMMLGIAVLHLLPHAWGDLKSIDRAAQYLLGGFLVMFFIQRFFHFHHHDVPDDEAEGETHHGRGREAHEPGDVARAADHAHAHLHEHTREDEHEHTLAGKSARQLSWGGAALGLTLHSLIDGVALAASVQAEALLGHPVQALAGFGTFLVVILHKPFDALAIGTLMAAGGWSRTARHWINGLFALAIPAGVLVFEAGAAHFADPNHHFVGAALAFTAGTFLCIAASDLLPELQFHSHDRIKLSLALMVGLILAGLIGLLEGENPGHDRGDHAEAPRPASTWGFKVAVAPPRYSRTLPDATVA